MNEMGKQWVVLGAFKLKEYSVSTNVDEVTWLYHRSCDTPIAEVDHLFIPEIMDFIANHECPLLRG